jgi:hypothetical protein
MNPYYGPPPPMLLPPRNPPWKKARAAQFLAVVAFFSLGPLLAIPAILMGRQAMQEMRLFGGPGQRGWGWAMGAQIIGVIVCLVWLPFCVLIAIAHFTNP